MRSLAARLPLRPSVDDLRDRATLVEAELALDEISAARLVEGAASELGVGGHVETSKLRAPDLIADGGPKPAPDASAAMARQDVDHVELEARRQVIAPGRARGGEADDLAIDLRDHFDAARLILRRRQPVLPLSRLLLHVEGLPLAGQRSVRLRRGGDVDERDRPGVRDLSSPDARLRVHWHLPDA